MQPPSHSKALSPRPHPRTAFLTFRISTAEKELHRRDSQSSPKLPKQARSVHPSGGLASALAGSGLALANLLCSARWCPRFRPPSPVAPELLHL